MNFLEYMFRGFIHWLSLLLGILDFKDIGFMWIVIIGVFVLALFNKSIRDAILGLIIPLFNVAKTSVGFMFLLLFIIYYIYIAFVFEESITFFVLIFSIWLFLKDFVRTNMNLLAESDTSVLNNIKEISIPVLLLYIQQLIMMFEHNNFDNLLFATLSLLIIPTFSVLFFTLKHYVNYEDIYVKYKRKLKFSGFYFMKIFNESLIESGSYNVNKKVLEEFLLHNSLLEFDEMKKKLILELPKLLIKYKINKKKDKHANVKISKIKKVFNIIWMLNILCTIYFVIMVRFFEGNFGFLYYYCLFVLFIYLWVDFMKIKSIENKSDFVIYGIIYLLLIIFIVCYSSSLKTFRLSELGFIIPLFLIIHFKYINKKISNFIAIPDFSENNFFNMTKEQYYNSLNRKKK